MAGRIDPYKQSRFRIEIDGITHMEFIECTFVDTLTEALEHRGGNEIPIFRKLSGLTKYGNIILKWGITDSMELYKWRRRVIETGAEGARNNISIILIDDSGRDKSRWNIEQAWPIKYKPPDFNANSNEIAIETLEISYEDIIRVS